MQPNFLRGYIARQLKHGHLVNWTIALINNTSSKEFYELRTSHTQFHIGYTFRKEVEETDSLDNVTTDPNRYLIRKAHIISPPS